MTQSGNNQGTQQKTATTPTAKDVKDNMRYWAKVQKFMTYNSHSKEVVEHFLILGLAPVLGFVLFRTICRSFIENWMNLVVASFLFSALWFVDQRMTGHLAWYKRIAHFAIAYIFASNYYFTTLNFFEFHR